MKDITIIKGIDELKSPEAISYRRKGINCGVSIVACPLLYDLLDWLLKLLLSKEAYFNWQLKEFPYQGILILCLGLFSTFYILKSIWLESKYLKEHQQSDLNPLDSSRYFKS